MTLYQNEPSGFVPVVLKGFWFGIHRSPSFCRSLQVGVGYRMRPAKKQGGHYTIATVNMDRPITAVDMEQADRSS